MTNLEKLEKYVQDTKFSFRGLRRNSLTYKSLKKALSNSGTKIWVGKNTGSGRYTSSVSWQDKCQTVLKSLSIAYEVGNNAPRGGKAGDYIIVYGN